MPGMFHAFYKLDLNMCHECFKCVLSLHQVCFKLSQLPSPFEGLVFVPNALEAQNLPKIWFKMYDGTPSKLIYCLNISLSVAQTDNECQIIEQQYPGTQQ